MGAAGWGIGCDGTAVKLAPQDGQKAASGGASLPQLGQNMIFIYFSLCIKNFRYQSRDCYICVLGFVLVEGVHSSKERHCSWYMNQKYGTSSASDKSLKEDTS